MSFVFIYPFDPFDLKQSICEPIDFSASCPFDQMSRLDRCVGICLLSFPSFVFVCLFFFFLFDQMPRLDGGAVVQALQLTSSAVGLPPSVHMDTTLEIIIKCIKIQTMPEGNHFFCRIPSLQSIKTESHTCNLKHDLQLGVQARSHRENFNIEFFARIFLGFCIDILSLECVGIL